MATRLLIEVINDCIDCPDKQFRGNYEWTCRLDTERRILRWGDNKTIPDWCPLPEEVQ